MKYQKIFFGTALSAVMATAPLFADVEDDIFKSGVEKTIEVMQYQKKLSLKNEDRNGRYCYKINPRQGEIKISDFWIVKLEALSLIATTDPLYFENKKGKRTLCFFTAATPAEYNAKKKLIEDKFENILKFHPQKIVLKQSDGITPIVPGLGKWNSDMTNTIQILNTKISELETKLFKCNTSLDKVLGAVKDIPKTVDNVVKEIKQTAEKGRVDVTPNDTIKVPKPSAITPGTVKKHDTAKKHKNKKHKKLLF